MIELNIIKQNEKLIRKELALHLAVKDEELSKINEDNEIWSHGGDVVMNIQTQDACLEFELDDYLQGEFSRADFYKSLDKNLLQIGRYRRISYTNFYFTRL